MAQLRMAEPRGHKVARHPPGACLWGGGGWQFRAQLSAGVRAQLSENFYVRKDGTRAYYFTEPELARLFLEAGFETESLEMHRCAPL